MKVDISKTKDNLIEWIKNYFNENGNDKTIAIVGISGGKDSSICARLLCDALGNDRVVGVLMPNDIQDDIDDSITLVNYLKIKHYIINIKDAFNSLTDEIKSKLDIDCLNNQYKTNTPSRIRMTTLYGVAQLLGNARVCNTGNLSEKMIGYTTLYGDYAGDFAPIACLTKSEVVAIGDELDLPKFLVHKPPTDGMSGKTDEDNIGFSYDELDDYIRNNIKGKNYNLIEEKINLSKFKRNILNIPMFDNIKWY